jgi:hypothetical protein
MRVWEKVIFVDTPIQTESKNKVYVDFAKEMGGYDVDDSYQSKESFFQKYFQGRYVDWDNYLQRNLHKDDEVLSIASGRCINELKLLNDSYSISCSDLKIVPSYDASIQLFGIFPFLVLDIIRKHPDKEYDGIICLSLIWTFNKDDLDTFFRNVNQGLSQGKYLFLDPGGGEENLFSFFWDVLYLPIEYKIFSFIYKLFGKRGKILVKDSKFGFRRTNEEIVESARRSGFEFVSREDFNFLDEFRRSILLAKIIKRSSTAQRFFSILGRWNPYVRVFKFKKTSNNFHRL